jgi:hypothetical protein
MTEHAGLNVKLTDLVLRSETLSAYVLNGRQNLLPFYVVTQYAVRSRRQDLDLLGPSRGLLLKGGNAPDKPKPPTDGPCKG